MNPTLPIATIKSSTTFSFRNDFKSPQNFKVPDLPASHRKIPHSNIGLPAATPAQKSIEPMHSTASNSKAQQEVTPIASRNSLLISSLSSQIDESIHELVDSIHKTVEEESLRIEKTCSDASDEEKEECSKTDILPEELLKAADTDKEPEEEEEDTPPPPPPPIKRGRGRPRKSEQSKAPSSSVSTATKLVKSTEKKKKTKADERKSHESLLKKIEAESGKKASRFDSWWLKSVPNPVRIHFGHHIYYSPETWNSASGH